MFALYLVSQGLDPVVRQLQAAESKSTEPGRKVREHIPNCVKRLQFQRGAPKYAAGFRDTHAHCSALNYCREVAGAFRVKRVKRTSMEFVGG